MSEPIRILSLGGGVQSSTIKHMIEHGELPKVDAAIFADTQSEPVKVYDYLAYLRINSSMPIITVTKGNLFEDECRIRRSAKSGKLYLKGSIPAFVKTITTVSPQPLNPTGAVALFKEDDICTRDVEVASIGLLGRRCTSDYKIVPIQRKCREIVGISAMQQWRSAHKNALKKLSEWETAKKYANIYGTQPPRRPQEAWAEVQADALVVQLIGISLDEAHRMKESRVSWIRSEWPLIDKLMTRQHCLNWISSKGLPIPPRSACVGCPFHGDAEWKDLKENHPEDFALAISYEKKIQEAARKQEVLKGIPFFHSSCIPLDEVQFGDNPAYGQISMFGNECEGMCGL